MWLLKHLLVVVVSIIYTVLATDEVSIENSETAAVSDIFPEDTEQVVIGSATQRVESLDVSQPDLINLGELDVDGSLDDSHIETDADNFKEVVAESFTENEASQSEDTPPVEKDVVEEISTPRENYDALNEPENFQQEYGIEASLNKQGGDTNTGEPNEGDTAVETPVPGSKIEEEADAQEAITTESMDAVDDKTLISEIPDQTMDRTANLHDEEGNLSVQNLSAEQDTREDLEQLQSRTGSDDLPANETGQMVDNEQRETRVDSVSDSPTDDETETSEESTDSPLLVGERSETSESEDRYQPSCGVWGVYQPESRYANISILALLFQDLFQKDEAEAAAILKDLASSVTMPMQDVLDKLHNVSEDISEMVDSADRIKRSPNSEFVEGLDDIDKFFEGVDVPDELDVGAVGSSIQEVLMGQGTQIVIKRLKMGFAAIQDGIMTMKVSVVESIEDIISRREEFATKRDVLFRRLQDGKIFLVERAVAFRDSDNDSRKELLQQLVRFSWRATTKTTNAVKEFVERLFEDGEDIQDILKESTSVDDEIKKMLRKLS